MTINTDAAPSEAFEEWASEEGINNFHFHHCWAAWQAALASIEATTAEPIYQTGWPSPDDVWGDVPKEAYDTYAELGYTKRRIVYSTLAAKLSTETVDKGVDRLAESVRLTLSTLQRQVDLIAERAPGPYLDKIPVWRSLRQHQMRLEKALAEFDGVAASNKQGGEDEV